MHVIAKTMFVLGRVCLVLEVQKREARTLVLTIVLVGRNRSFINNPKTGSIPEEISKLTALTRL
jgi:hypothetical protein